MRWTERARLWFVIARFRRRVMELQHDQAVEHSAIVDEVKERYRSIIHELADPILVLDAVSDQLEAADEEKKP